MSKCKTCGKEILWASTASGKKIPLNPMPASNGNLVLDKGLARHARPDAVGERYVSHFVTCPGAAKHRRGKP